MAVDEQDWLDATFEEHRPQLRAVAFRMLGPAEDADDAVQDAWLRVSRADTDGVENRAAWLTTVTARVCLNVMRARKQRREEPFYRSVLAHHPRPPGARERSRPLQCHSQLGHIHSDQQATVSSKTVLFTGTHRHHRGVRLIRLCRRLGERLILPAGQLLRRQRSLPEHLPDAQTVETVVA